MKDIVTDDVITCRGLHFPLDDRFLGWRQRRLLRSGSYEQREFRAAMAHARPDDVVVELGAGIGFMSTAVAVKRHVRHVHAYEANPSLIPYIARVHAANGVTRASIHNAILMPEAGPPADFFVRGEFDASSLADNLGDDGGGVVSVEKVEVRSISEALRGHGATMLICDIEGAEAQVLPGADLSGLSSAVVELHPQTIGQAGVQAVFDAMANAGLTYYPRSSNKKVVTFLRGW